MGDLIGTDATGTRALPNAHGGVFINGAPFTLVGGPGGARDVISGNGGPGVVFSGAGATGGAVQNDLIGTDVTGETALGNAGDGVYLANAPANLIGGLGASDGDVISGNGLTGVRIEGAGASANVVVGNLIGTDATGAPRGAGNAYEGASSSTGGRTTSSATAPRPDAT